VEIENWLYGLPLAHQTMNHILYTLKTIVDEAEREGIIDRNPIRKVGRLADQPRKRDIFTLTELTALFPDDPRKLTKIRGSDMFATLYLILAMTGIRPGEARGLQWKNVDLVKGGIYIVQALDDQGEIKSPKSGEFRVTPLPSRTWNALSAWQSKTFLPDPSDWVFYGVDKRPLSKKVVSTHLRPALAKAKIKVGDRNIVTYSFRHTFNTYAKRVLPITTLQEILGHSSDEMTKLYDHPQLSDSMRKLLPYREQLNGIFEVPKVLQKK
jgi:integrase